jgi:PAS domain S-box-containing protein
MRLPLTRWLPRLSARAHLALGLAALTVCVLLSATWLGLVPDTEARERAHRVATAETIAVATSNLLDENDTEPLRQTLAFMRERNPEVLSMGVRAHDGRLLVEAGEHALRWHAPADASAGDTAIVVPVFQAGEPWGDVELAFAPLRTGGRLGQWIDPGLRLAAFVFASSFIAFLGYLRRMLRELDPSRAVPQRVRTAYDTLTEGLMVVDGDGRIVLANRSTSEMLGVAEGALVGHSPSEFDWERSGGGAIERAALPWEIALATRTMQRDVHLEVRARNGTRYALRANCSPILDARQRLQAVVLSFQDVTELERRGQALRAAKELADAANEAKSRFLANMSHEIRTPMNAILGFSEVLRRGGLRDESEAQKHLAIIHSSGRHLLNLINDILDLSKVEAGRLEAECLPTAPHQVAREVVQTLAGRAAEKGLGLALEIPEPLPVRITADPARLRQIVTNLVGNAIKFTDAGGVRVVLRLEAARAPLGPRYRVDVVDTGIGIPADRLESVFEPFVQAESSTTRRFGGTGLGLTISRGFARAMGGDIDIASEPGAGTTFSLWLPLEPSALHELCAPEALAAEPTGDTAAQARQWRFPPRRVLVVDDGVENRELVHVLLEQVGLTVLDAENGAVALERVAEGGLDLVLMDMQMPVMDGATATRTLRERGCALPILALTANVMKGYEQQLAQAGFTGALTKPIDVDALLQALAPLLGGEAVPAADGPAPAPAAPMAGVDGTSAAKVARHADDAAAASSTVAPAHSVTPIVSRHASHPKLGAIARRFALQLPAKLVEMRSVADQGDAAGLAALAHWLKGAGGSMGFDSLFEPSRELETAARSGDLAQAGAILDILDRIEHRIRAGMAEPTLQSNE